MSNDRLKFRQFYEGKFHYWGVGVDGCSFVGPVSGGQIRADNTINDQWTGLYDSEGVEIYEGDIVKSYLTEASYLVCWSDEYSAWYKQMLNANVADRPIYQDSSEWWVVGNLHENPDLMERANG